MVDSVTEVIRRSPDPFSVLAHTSIESFLAGPSWRADADLPGDFKLAMRRLASTVSILTAVHEGERFGMAATAVTSLSSSPPSMLACVNRSASIHRPIALGKRYCVNLLSPEHADLVPTFSGKVSGEQRFSMGRWATGEAGTPYLADAQASLFCALERTVDYGTHSIFIGRVERVIVTGEPSTLVYQEGALHRTTPLLD